MPSQEEKKAGSAVTLSSAVVRWVCVSASFVVLACALLGLGVACVAIEKFSTDSAPCPDDLELIVFSTAGGLLVLSVVLFLVVGRKRKRLRARHDEERLLASTAAAGAPSNPDNAPGDSSGPDLQVNDVRTNPGERNPQVNHCAETEHFAMTQKSVDVGYWVEQQKSMPEECFPLDAPCGAATGPDSDAEGSEDEVTAL